MKRLLLGLIPTMLILLASFLIAKLIEVIEIPQILQSIDMKVLSMTIVALLSSYYTGYIIESMINEDKK